MKKFKYLIEVVEVYQKIIEVEAETIDESQEKLLDYVLEEQTQMPDSAALNMSFVDSTFNYTLLPEDDQ